MITGAHAILYSGDPDALRAYLRDVVGLGDSLDAGGGWLIFALPPAEVAVHPAETAGCELFLMCDDLDATMAELRGRGAVLADVGEERWGRVTYLELPGGGRLGLYQPRHPVAGRRES